MKKLLIVPLLSALVAPGCARHTQPRPLAPLADYLGGSDAADAATSGKGAEASEAPSAAANERPAEDKRQYLFGD